MNYLSIFAPKWNYKGETVSPLVIPTSNPSLLKWHLFICPQRVICACTCTRSCQAKVTDNKSFYVLVCFIGACGVIYWFRDAQIEGMNHGSPTWFIEWMTRDVFVFAATVCCCNTPNAVPPSGNAVGKTMICSATCKRSDNNLFCEWLKPDR